MRVIMDVRELEEVLSKKWFNPERRLYNMLIRTRGRFNKKRYLRALVKKLQKKGVILLPDVIEKLYKS